MITQPSGVALPAPHVLGERVPSSRSRRLHRAWKLDVATDVVRLRAELDARRRAIGRDLVLGERAGEARGHLDEVEALLGRWWQDLLSSSSIDAVYRNLHEAEVAIVATLDPPQLIARTPYLVAKAQRVLPKADPQRAAVERLAKMTADDLATTSGRLAYAEATRAVYEVADSRYARMRRLRGNLRIVTLMMAAALALLIVLGLRSPGYLPLCFQPQPAAGSSVVTACPTSEQRTSDGDQRPVGPAAHDVLVVAVLGAVGGALSGALAVRRFRPPPYTPYNLPLQTFLLKLPVGALTALGGLVLLRGHVVPGLSELDSQGQILAYALIFGFAQHLFTRYVDVHAEKLLLAAPPRSDRRDGKDAAAPDDD